MRKFYRHLPCSGLCLISVLIAPIAAAQLDSDYYLPDLETTQTLDAAGLQTVFSGKTHLGTYSFLREDISTYAFSETTFSDGRIEHIQQTHEKKQVDTGQWEIEDDRICYDYDDPRLHQACFTIYVVGNCYYHHQVEVQGYPASGFTARSVIKGERPNCEPPIA
ncbi:MAG: hypothetical protein ABJG88_10180 [Litorimonas sp.]